MSNAKRALPWIVIAIAAAGLAWHGPIAQLANYHDFADQRAWLGVPHALDVISSFAFVAVAAWAFASDRRVKAATVAERRARGAFILALFATALGSAWYHLAPDNARLVFDRLPIALACAAVLAAAHVRCTGRGTPWTLALLLAAAVASVAWWSFTEARGAGDLRPYLALQMAPLVLVPLWQWRDGRPMTERGAFATAIALYVAAKVLELADHAVLAALGVVSGHTLKHLLAAAAAVFVVKALRGAAAGDRVPTTAPAAAREVRA